MSVGRANAAYCAAFVDELARSGLRHACVGPGSRSTPLALALAEHPGVRVWVIPDERSAAFFALGLSKAGRAPVALLCTSGTAAANFHPAVIEARYGRVPLVVLTADRPPELRDRGAPQAIDQVGLYGDHVKWSAELALPEDTPQALRYVRATACRAYATALGSPAGPVHLNFPFREPLLPDGGEAVVPPDVGEARPDGLPYAAAHAPRRLAPQPLVQRLAGELAAAERGLLVCGPQDDPALPGALVGLAGRLGWPLLADGLSGLRSGPHDQELLVDAYDAFLRDESFALEHGPDLVLRFGATPTSKTLTQCLARHPHSRHIVVDEGEGWRDPTLLASDFVHAEPVALCESLTDALPVALSASAPWTDRWLDANRRTRRALGARLSTLEEPFEGRVFAELPALLPEGSTLYVGNSMPVRDLDAFFSATVRSVRVLCNRGANGIDGVVSSALGAGAGSGGPLVLVLGDLSFYHDMNGLLAAKLYGLDATVILLNNDGGGIFSFLPQAATPEHFETLFGTPHGLDLGAASRMYGGRHTLARTWEGFRDAVRAGIGSPGLAVVELRTDRGRNVELHRELWAAVAAALAEPGRPRAVDAVAIGAE